LLGLDVEEELLELLELVEPVEFVLVSGIG
jgi:hypothetical protein